MKLHENLRWIRHIYVLDFEIDPTVSHIFNVWRSANPVPRPGCDQGERMFERKVAVAMLRHRVAKKLWPSEFSETFFRSSVSSFRKGFSEDEAAWALLRRGCLSGRIGHDAPP